METCQHCDSEVDKLCIVSVFTPGRDNNGIHNTEVIGRLCNACIVLLTSGEIQLDKPSNALTFDDLLGGVELSGTH